MDHPRLVGGLTALAVLFILFAAPAAFAASLPVVWSDSYVSAAGDSFSAIAAGPGGAVYAAGYAGSGESGSGSELLLVKYVDTGATMSREWARTYSAVGFDTTSATEVAVAPSGDVIVAGTQGPFEFHGPGSDIIVLKYSSAGDLVWQATYDGPAHYLDYIKGLALDADGNALVVGASAGGHTGRDYVTLKVNADGTRAWARRYAGPSGSDEARSVAVDPDGNVYVTGGSRTAGSRQRTVSISYTASGARRWIIVDRRARSSSGMTIMYCGVRGAEGVVVSGVRYLGTPGYDDLSFVKYRALDGGLAWSRSLSAGKRSSEWPLAAALDGTGAPIAAGYRMRTVPQAWLAGVSATGGDAWHNSFTSPFTNAGGWADFGSIAVGTDGRLLAGGLVESAPRIGEALPTAFLVRFSPSWPVTAPQDYVGAGDPTGEDKCTAVAIGANGMYAVGHESSATGDTDAVLLKF